jgi:PAS domain S-box-containing protein
MLIVGDPRSNPADQIMSNDTDSDAAELRNLRLLGEYCSDVIATVNSRMIIGYISPSVARLFGWPVDAALGHPISEFVVEEDLPEIAVATAKLSTGKIRSATVIRLCKTPLVQEAA